MENKVKDAGMKKVYVCTRQGQKGSRDTDLEFAKVYSMAVIEEGSIPICPRLFFDQIINEDVETQKESGRMMGLELLKGCDELRIFSRITEEMKEEIILAEEMGIPTTIGNVAYIYSDEMAAAIVCDIFEDLEELYGKKHHSEEN